MRYLALLATSVLLMLAPLYAQSGSREEPKPVSDTGRVPPLRLVKGGRVLVDGSIERLREGRRVVALTEDGQLTGSSQIDRAECLHRIDVAGLDRATQEVLRRERLALAHRELRANQLILITRPWVIADQAHFYSYTAEVRPCSSGCTVTLAAHYVTAPFRDRIIFLNDATKRSDDVTAALIRAAQREFSRCIR